MKQPKKYALNEAGQEGLDKAPDYPGSLEEKVYQLLCKKEYKDLTNEERKEVWFILSNDRPGGYSNGHVDLLGVEYDYQPLMQTYNVSTEFHKDMKIWAFDLNHLNYILKQGHIWMSEVTINGDEYKHIYGHLYNGDNLEKFYETGKDEG